MQRSPRSSSASSRFPDRANRFSGRRATSQAVVLPVLALFVLSNSFRVSTGESEELYTRISISVGTGIIAWIYFTIFGMVVNKFAPDDSIARRWLIGFLFVSTEAGRATLSHWFELSQGLDSTSSWLFLVVCGGSNGLVMFGLLSIVLNDIDSYQGTYRQLSERRLLLENLISSAELNLAKTREQLVFAVRNSLTHALDRIFATELFGTQKDEDIVDELLKVSDDVVRPISHDLFETPRPVLGQEIPVTPPRVPLSVLFDNGTKYRPIRGRLFFGFCVVLTAPLLLLTSDISVVWLYLLSLIALALCIYLMTKAAVFVSRISALFIRIIVTSAMYMVMGFAAGVVFLSGMFADVEVSVVIILISVLSLFLGWVIAITEGLRTSRDLLLEELAIANDELEWQQARLQSQAWVEQKNIALVLHNDVQPTLIAGALRYRNEREAGQSRDESLARLRSLVSESINIVLSEQTEISLDELGERLQDRWSGILNITLFVDKKTRTAIAGDPLILRILDDVLSDAMTNTVKYGHAKNVSIRLKSGPSAILTLTTIHDGTPLEPGYRPQGLGSKLFDTVTLSWQLRNDPGGTGVEMIAVFPLGMQAS